MEKEKIISAKTADVESSATPEVSPVCCEAEGERVDRGETGEEEPQAKEGETVSDTGGGEKDDARMEALIAEAEQRGYLRGRNENIRELMREPGMLERGDSSGSDEGYAADVEILQRERISIWDL